MAMGVWQSAAQCKRTRSEIVGYAILTLLFRQKRTTWTGECVELGTATDGPTLDRTHDELVDLVILHLNALEEAGERDRFFKKHGVQLYAADAAPAEVQLRLPVSEDVFVHTHRVPLSRAA